MSRALAGTATLARLVVRRDRVVVPACVLAVGTIVFGSASSLQGLYPTAAERARLATTIADNPALIAIRGRPRGLESTGGLVAFQIGATGAVVVALMSLLLVGRHTRGEEERGRTELLRAGVAGRYAPIAAAVGVVAAVDAVTGAVVASILVALGLPPAGAVALGASFAAVGLVFAGIAALAAQVTESARAAAGIAASALGGAYVLRAAGDVGDGTLSWLSPIGWGQATRPFAGERWWPLLLSLAAAAVLVAAACALLSRRDLGAGLLAPRPGRAVAGPRLATPLGFALRLQRGALGGWSAGLFCLGLADGAVGRDIQDLLDTSSGLADFFTRAGGPSPVDAFFATIFLLLALVATGFTIQAVLRLRGEESAGRAEPVLGTAIGRRRWAAAHLAVALAGTVVVLAAAGVGAGLAYGVRSGHLGDVPRLAGAALAQAPAVWVLGGVAAAAFGLAPRATAVAWVALAACVAVAILWPILGLPGWLSDLSPYAHASELPARSLDPSAALGLSAGAAALVAVGLAAFARRDLSGAS